MVKHKSRSPFPLLCKLDFLLPVLEVNLGLINLQSFTALETDIPFVLRKTARTAVRYAVLHHPKVCFYLHLEDIISRG